MNGLLFGGKFGGKTVVVREELRNPNLRNAEGAPRSVTLYCVYEPDGDFPGTGAKVTHSDSLAALRAAGLELGDGVPKPAGWDPAPAPAPAPELSGPPLPAEGDIVEAEVEPAKESI